MDLFADDYYPALERSNVILETAAIERITPAGVRTSVGVDHPLDVLVFATGFETTSWHWSLEVTGRGGAHLRCAWKQGPEAYLGLTVSGFPNFFISTDRARTWATTWDLHDRAPKRVHRAGAE